jgi:hypothetical protein
LVDWVDKQFTYFEEEIVIRQNSLEIEIDKIAESLDVSGEIRKQMDVSSEIRKQMKDNLRTVDVANAGEEIKKYEKLIKRINKLSQFDLKANKSIVESDFGCVVQELDTSKLPLVFIRERNLID